MWKWRRVTKKKRKLLHAIIRYTAPSDFYKYTLHQVKKIVTLHQVFKRYTAPSIVRKKKKSLVKTSLENFATTFFC